MNLLEKTIAEAVRDSQTVTTAGKPMRKLPEGVELRPSVRHVDPRGSIRELWDKRWGFHPAPVEFSYVFTVNPGTVKGWGLHQKHDDRYFLLKGEVELVLYDVRPGSSTEGQIFSITLNEFNPGIINIPAGIWHADHNFGSVEALVLNFPTMMYDHAAPDKLRLPIDTDLIPWSFGDATGG